MQVMYKQLSKYYNDVLDMTSVQTDTETNLLDQVFKENKVKTVLDVGCGVGRHSIALSKLGYTATGLDFSSDQIKNAKAQAKRECVDATFILGDANRFSTKKKYDAAICMWSTLGEEPMQYPKVIINVFNALKPGGIFLIDNKNWDAVSKNPKIRKDSLAKDGLSLKRTMQDRYTDHFRIRLATFEVNKKKIEEMCITHLINKDEWIAELKKAGFQSFSVFYDYQPKVEKNAKRIQIVAQK